VLKESETVDITSRFWQADVASKVGEASDLPLAAHYVPVGLLEAWKAHCCQHTDVMYAYLLSGSSANSLKK
jgi:hypothetical protein